MLSINDDLDLFYEKMIFNTQECNHKRQNEYRQMHLFQRIAKIAKADLLCKLKFHNRDSLLGTYQRIPRNGSFKVRNMFLEQDASFSTKCFEEAILVFPSLNIPKPFFPEIPFPSGVYSFGEVTREKLSEDFVEKYPYIESSCDRFTMHL